MKASLTTILESLFDSKVDTKTTLLKHKKNEVLYNITKYAKCKFFDNDGFPWAGRIQSKTKSGNGFRKTQGPDKKCPEN